MKKGDVISIVNHSSGGPSVNLSQEAGGLLPSVSALLIIVKIAPSPCKDEDANVKCKDEWNCLYDHFKRYLLSRQHLQIGGSAFVTSITSTSQIVPINSSIIWNTVMLSRNIRLKQGTAEMHIEQSGEYDFYVDIIGNTPSQYTVFVNGNPVNNSISGGDSGSNRTVLRQIVKLYKGDIVTIRNWQSRLGPIVLSGIAGGFFVNSCATLSVYKLSTIEDKN